jgi:hypothetical protein
MMTAEEQVFGKKDGQNTFTGELAHWLTGALGKHVSNRDL